MYRAFNLIIIINSIMTSPSDTWNNHLESRYHLHTACKNESRQQSQPANWGNTACWISDKAIITVYSHRHDDDDAY